jgi:hypothetical protein
LCGLPHRRQRHTEANHLQHEIARHLDDIGPPVQLLQLVGEKVRLGEGVAIDLDMALDRVIGGKRVAPADRPAGMLGADPPALQPWLQTCRVEGIAGGHAVNDDEAMDIELDL